jgi:N-acetylneuraminate synthase
MTINNSSTRPRIIAEIGCNHAGSMETAERMIHVAAHFCEVDAVKFQKRNPSTLLSPDEYNAPHPNAAHSYGTTYGEHREFLEFTTDQHRRLADVCKSAGVVYATSVWDIPSAQEMIGLTPDFIKVPSATNLNFDLLTLLCDAFDGQIHVSLGMTARNEEEDLINFLKAHDRLSSTVLYACTSGYPVPFEDICLGEITRLREKYGSMTAGIGFSGHHLGIAADVAAQTLGADWIERHFTLDRTMKGTDHAASLEPDGMRRLTRDVKAVAKALTFKEDEILPIEAVQREKLKWHGPE